MPKPFRKLRGMAAPLPKPNIDTDVIIRIERLTGENKGEIGDYAFEALRYLPDGSADPNFPFNQDKWKVAPILIAGSNFGCGSSREVAVNAILGMGVRCIIADSFGDIFYANCFQNGLLPVRLPTEQVAELTDVAYKSDEPFEVDLETCTVTPPGREPISFQIDSQRREAMLAGLDDIGLTLMSRDEITLWQQQDHEKRPWAWAELAEEKQI